MAAVALGGSSTDRWLASLLLRPYHSEVRERPARKNYVMHPKLLDLYSELAVTTAVERIAAEEQAKVAA
jgi:hypothetical protein